MSFFRYIHRDLKPANLAIGLNGKEARVAHLLDFGLSRQYVVNNNGKAEMRRPRGNTLFRGTGMILIYLMNVSITIFSQILFCKLSSSK